MWNRDCVTYSQNLGEVCADFSWSLCRLRLKFVQTTAEVSRKYYVLTNLSTRTHTNKCVYSLKCLRVLTETSTSYSHKRKQTKRPLGGLPKDKFLLVLLWSFAECGNRKALRLKAQGVYYCKWRGLNIDNNAASAVLCNGLKKGVIAKHWRQPLQSFYRLLLLLLSFRKKHNFNVILLL